MRLEFKPINMSIISTCRTYLPPHTDTWLLTRIVLSGQFPLSDLALMTPGIRRDVLNIGKFIRRLQTLLTPPAGVSHHDLQFYFIALWRKYQVVETNDYSIFKIRQTTVRYIQNYYSKILEVLFCLKEVVFYRRLKSFFALSFFLPFFAF